MEEYIYGLDLSMEQTGVTIFNKSNCSPVYIGSIKTKKNETHGKRLKYIEDQVIGLVNQYPPSVIVIERGFARFNTSTQVIYRVHGVINKLFHDYEQIYYPPKTVKEAIVRGDATKLYVKNTIEKVYTDVVFVNEDESDSFAVGLTYFIKNGLIQWDKSEVKKKAIRRKKGKNTEENKL